MGSHSPVMLPLLSDMRKLKQGGQRRAMLGGFSKRWTDNDKSGLLAILDHIASTLSAGANINLFKNHSRFLMIIIRILTISHIRSCV